MWQPLLFSHSTCLLIFAFINTHIFRMTRINDLDPKVLYQILCLASGPLAKNIDEWKLKLTLLQVCTEWYGLLKSYVFSQGFVGIYSLKPNRNPYIDMKSCVYYADSNIVCRSNLGIITGRDEYNCNCVTELDVGVDRMLTVSMYGHILQKLSMIGIGYWLYLNSLTFNSTLRTPPPFKAVEPNLEECSATAAKYIHDFQYRIPNITHLQVIIQENKTLLTAIWILIEHYAQHLKYLHIFHLGEQQFLPQFSTKLQHIFLNLGTCSYQNSSFYPKSLQFLHFFNIPCSTFSWWLFHDFSTPGHIEFTNLTTLSLLYTNQTDKEKKLSEKCSKQARPYGSHMLRFPKLESLTLNSPPVDCDVFYTDTIPSHLENLTIHGDCNEIVASSRLRFTSANKIYIGVYGDTAPNDDFYKAVDRYFGYIRIGSSCGAHLGLPIDVKRTGSWVNLTYLRIYNIGSEEMLDLITNVYRLQHLTIDNIRFDDEPLEIIWQGLEEEMQGKSELLDTRLEHLSLYNTKSGNPHQLFAILNHLFLRTTTLKEFKTDHTLGLTVERSFLPDKFPSIKFSS